MKSVIKYFLFFIRRVLFYPDEPRSESEVKFIIENRTSEECQYKFQITCDGGITIDWETDFYRTEEQLMYDSSMSQETKYIEELHSVPKQEWFGPKNKHFTFNAVVTVRQKNNSNKLNLSTESFVIYPSEDDIDQFDTCTLVDEVIAPTSVRSPAFMACISKIIVETKDDSLPDLVILATKLLEAAKKFNLPDLEKISSGFLDFQISDNNFADILEIAVDQKITALLNSATEYITNNQKELRETDQWEKMKTCPVMLLSILEKLFEKKVKI